MTKEEETRRQKARNLRYKKPIAKDLNIWMIRDELDEISEECDNVRYFWETDEETLINAMDGDEDEAYEFKMMFADLCAECDQMREDLENHYVPECFDLIFVAGKTGGSGGYLGFDTYEQDYFGLDLPSEWMESEAAKQLKRMTKDELIECMAACLKVYQSYIGLHYRYDSLKAAFDILRDKNTGYLRLVKNIEELYEQAAAANFYEYDQAVRQFNNMLKALPPEAYL